MGHRGVGAAAAALLVAVALAVAPADGARRPSPVVITVLSNRADLISGGDALVRVQLPARSRNARVKITVGKRDVTRKFTRDGQTLTGLVTRLKNGKNVLSARLRDGSGARIAIDNHPQGGPVFSGPQIQPWECEKGAVDKQCNKPPVFSYVYKSTDPNKSGLQPYNPKSPPEDVASTTSQTGVSVPFIVRVETGYIDRDQYKIAALYQPGKAWTALDPQKQFNHKLLITHGASCDIDYSTASAPSVTDYNPANFIGLPVSLPDQIFADSASYALGSGFVLMSTALDNNGHNCNIVTQAESLMMTKERVIERYGTLRYTIGTGCSGGSLAQQWIANAYPGIYQGILPTCSFPDTWSSATQVMDYHLLRSYFENSSHWGPDVAWLPTQWGAVEGNLLPVDAIISDIGFFNAIVPTHGCGGTTDKTRYNPQTNIGGIRCSISDYSVNVFGPRSPAVWTANEKKLGRGFAGVAVDNVGVQYGLQALNSLQITPAQFVDLNARIGGLDIDINPTKARISADRPALANAYRSGMINEANNLNQTAIIDCRGPDPGAAHDSYRAFAVRDRLDREHGSHANQLIWEGPVPIVGDTACGKTSLIAMDRWLDAVDKDTSSAPFSEKIVADKPADLTDECWAGTGIMLTRNLCGEVVVPVYGTPRTVAGDALTTDANKCQLKPLSRSDYAIGFSEQQWLTLRATFPDGVCDYSKPGVDQQPTIPWQQYGTAKKVIYGGKPIGAAPRSTALAPRRRR